MKAFLKELEKPSLSFNLISGSYTLLVMGMVHSRRPLALASSARACAMSRAPLSRSQTDPVLFLPHQTGPRISHLVKPQRHQWRCHRPRPSEANAQRFTGSVA